VQRGLKSAVVCVDCCVNYLDSFNPNNFATEYDISNPVQRGLKSAVVCVDCCVNYLDSFNPNHFATEYDISNKI